MVNKEPWLAVNFSTFIPGAGQLYTGQTWKGCALILIYTGIVSFAFREILFANGNIVLGITFLVLALGLWLWNLYDAFTSTKRRNSSIFERKRIQEKDPWLAMLLSQLLFGLGNFYLGKWWWGVVGIVAIITSSYLVPWLSPLVVGIVAFTSYLVAPIRRDRTLLRAIIVSSLIIITSWLFLGIQTLIINGYEARWIPSGAMEPTLQGALNSWQADRVLVNKWLYRFQQPQRGDIVVFRANQTLREQGFGDTFIQRIVALPHEKVELRSGKIYINDRLLLEDRYIKDNKRISLDVCGVTGQTPYLSTLKRLPNNSYLTLGDNRSNSYDGRCWGTIPRSNIIGKAYKRYLPLNRIGSLEVS